MKYLFYTLLFLSSLLHANNITYTDTFQTNTLSQYTTEDTWTDGGRGSFNYDGTSQRVHLLTGDNIGLVFSKALPSAVEGSFSIDFLPTKYYPSGGFITLKLIQDDNTYYKIQNTDGYGVLAVSKYVNGVEVDVAPFSNEYIQNINYTIVVTFSPTVTTVQAFGETLTINSNTTDIIVNSFSVSIAQQDAYFDNIVYNIAQAGENTLPVANAGVDKSTQVNQLVNISGTGIDSDGTISTYVWTKGSTILADTASFSYTPTIEGNEILTLTVTDNNGSTASDDMILTITAEPIQSEEVIIDNSDADFSTTGTWAVSIATDVYSDNSLYSRTVDSSATWTPILIESGIYEVYVWYSGSEYGNRDTSADYTVNYAGGSETIMVNQDQGSGSWLLIGTFSFNAGSNGNVTLVSNTNNSRVSIADAVKFVFLDGTAGKNIQFNLPRDNSIHVDRNLISNVWTSDLTLGWGVKFILDKGTPNEQISIDAIHPYEITFLNVELGEHKVDAYIIDELQNEQVGEENHDSVENIGIGDIIVAVGDSITFGYGDDLGTDNISIDGRNVGGGFAPILNNKLSALYGYPHSIINEGIMGEKTEEGFVRLQSLLTQYTEASTFLILYGANDTNIWSNLESGKGLYLGDIGYLGTYKDYLKQMIDLVNNVGKKIAIAKVPFALGESPTSRDYSNPIEDGHRNVKAREFNEAIDELVNNPLNKISIVPPDFYSYYKDDYLGKYFDNLHPNGLGYDLMAELWKNALMNE